MKNDDVRNFQQSAAAAAAAVSRMQNQNQALGLGLGLGLGGSPSIMPKIRGVISGGSLSGVESEVKNIAWKHDCALTLEVDRGWFVTVCRFLLYGEQCHAAADAISRLHKK